MSRHAPRIRAFALLTLLVALASPPAAFGQGRSGIIPLSEVQPGMRGYGLTVFEGTEPGRFDVEVIGIMRNFLPRQDVILIRASHPTLAHSGIVGGMSGSPIYLGGRLAGALAYGWRFAKDPIAGVTPIERMLPELDRPLRGIPGATLLPASGTAPVRRREPRPRPRASFRTLPPDLASLGRPDGYWRRFGLGEAAAFDDDTDSLVPVATPLSVAGFTPAVRRALERLLAPYGIVPMQGAGGGVGGRGPGAAPRGLVAGGGVGVQLLRGDMDATSTGTVTYVEGNKVLAFGHPMMNLGEQYFPITTARVHTFLASLQRSFKIADPIEVVGSLTQDRQACIAGDISRRATMIPARVRIHDRTTGREERFDVEMVQHRFLTPALAFSVMADALADGTQDVADVRYTVRSHVKVSGEGALDLTEHGFSVDGATPMELAGLRIFRGMGQVLMNPFRDVALEGIDLDVDVLYDRDVHEIRGVHLTSDEVAPGERVNVYVTLRPYGGVETVRAIPFEVPPAADGANLEVEVASGPRVRIELAEPENVRELMRNIERGYPATSLVVSLKLPSQGVALRGHVVHDLPPSALSALRPSLASETPNLFATRRRIEHEFGHLTTGSASVVVRVRSPGGGGGAR